MARIDPTSRRVRAIVLVAVLAFALVLTGCGSGAKTDEDADTAPTYTLDDLKGQQLADQQEGLIFSYVQLGGIKAVESRFGKPTKSYQALADGTADGFMIMDDGHEWYYLVGEIDGKDVVMSHTVQALDGEQPSEADKAFIAAIADGKTPAKEADAYFKSAGGANYQPIEVNTQAIKVPAYVWEIADGSGFLVWDYSKLTQEQLAEYDFQAGEGPYRASWWDASRFRTYPPEEIPAEEGSITPVP